MTWPTEQAREAVARSLSAHWRDMHTNEALGLQRMLARHTLEALAPHVAALVRAERAAALHDAADRACPGPRCGHDHPSLGRDVPAPSLDNLANLE